jgi:hypothetical protein
MFNFMLVIPILPGSPLQLAIADGEAAVCDVLHRLVLFPFMHVIHILPGSPAPAGHSRWIEGRLRLATKLLIFMSLILLVLSFPTADVEAAVCDALQG